MKLAATRALYAYWDELRGARVSPDRADLDPSRIRGLLCDVFMLEADAEDTFPFRLAGARLASLFLRELKGEAFADLWLAEDRDEIREILASVLDDPTPAILGVTTAPPGRTPLELELLLLPLRHLGRTRARILGCLTPAGHPGWYGLLPVEGLARTSLRILAAHPLQQHSLSQVARMTGETPAANPLRRHQLRIYSGGL